MGADDLSARFVSDDHPASTWFSVVPSVEPVSPRGEALVHDIRAVPGPLELSVTGLSAQLVDTKDALFSRLPLAAGIIALVTFLVLFLQFGSVVIPIKAIILNLLSLSATFGAMVWIFQDGNLSDALSFTAIGSVDATTPILMFCVAFGLSMDYEVFLLSRIKEEFERTGDPQNSVADGLASTARVITAAAAIMIVVFGSFMFEDNRIIKLFGVGLATAVLLDASLVRMLLVPATMELLGTRNWWLPRWLDRLLPDLNVEGSEPPPLPPSNLIEGADLDRLLAETAAAYLADREPVASVE
jgi:RND superfamily putative drug exporter